ncbi:MAG TPA: ABC transporter permease [Candidatus Eisenbacteria bacterium]|nr:ABC transporter permease [Candidatus Eisenbacteria bacterium]
MHSAPRTVQVGAAVLAVLVIVALAAPLVAPGDPYRSDLPGRLATPSAAHVFGCDGLGRDLFARIAYGARVSLGVATVVIAISLAVGVAVGAGAALAGGWVDTLLARAIDIVLAFPGLLLAIALAAVRGPGVANVVIALAALGWPGYARLARAEITGLRTREFAQAARALGARPARVLVRHLLPAALPTLLVQATFGFSGVIIAESSLSFLGLGVPPPLPSWGAMLDEGRQFLLVAPHLVIFPGAVLALTVLALQLVGDGLRDWLDVSAGSADSRTSSGRPPRPL